MTIGRERRVETRFARQATSGRGVGLEEAVAGAEARLEGMREDVRQQIAEALQQMQAARSAVAAGDEAAARLIRAKADALVGLCGLFDLQAAGAAALSLCKLFDGCLPELPPPRCVEVHLDAIQMFLSPDFEDADVTASQVLEGLRRVATMP